VLVDVLDDLGKAVAADLGPSGAYIHLDVREEKDWLNAVATTVTLFGHLNVLVNNAAILRLGFLEEFPVDEFREVVEVNQVGPFLGMRAVVPAMRAAGGGSIINVSSTDGLHGREGVIAYSGTKWALRGMTKVAAQELGRHNIRVNSVYPGGIVTEMSKSIGDPGVSISRDEVKMRWALTRFPELEEVARVILFLASDEASYTTGAEITCDGGATIGPRYV
jgi:3alpha(or 20beta)-hydroxysteroid dehydrogenase